MKLSIEYIPSSTWGKNLRDLVYSQPEWTKVSKKVQSNANRTCEICNRIKDGVSITRLYCHEVWSYDLSNKVQRLEKLQCLCFECHSVIHLGFSIHQGYDIDSLTRHFLLVNETDLNGFNNHLKESNDLYTTRDKIEWVIDFNGFDKIDTTSPHTEALRKRREEDYIIIEDYLRNNPNAKNGKIQRATGVSLGSVRSFFIKYYWNKRHVL